MLMIRRSRDRLFFSMGIPIPEKDSLYIETGPCTSVVYLSAFANTHMQTPNSEYCIVFISEIMFIVIFSILVCILPHVLSQAPKHKKYNHRGSSCMQLPYLSGDEIDNGVAYNAMVEF